MKKITAFIMGLMILCTTNAANAQQDYCCEPCDTFDDFCCDINFSVYADYLYWKVCRTDLDFFNNNDDTFYINPGFDSGWRIGGRIQKCHWDLGVRYTSFNTSKTIHPRGPDFEDESRVHYSSDWDIVDIEVGYSLYHNCDMAILRPFVGAKLAWIDEKFGLQSIEFFDRRNDLNFNGYGLYTGAEGRFMLYQAQVCNTCIPFTLIGRGSVAVLDSTFCQTTAEGIVAEEDTIKRNDQCVFVPVLEAFVGLDIGGTECYCVTPHVLIGYEVQSWLDRRFDDSDEVAFIGLGGLVARLSLDY